ncbi:MAG TPA: 4Fe-4S dicluster domain-containing protein [Vicinamibacteria bacterium]|nr:4Fe-4S dicluster domain-containing protein [Vicinamibacteria bacterium]
MKPYQAPPPAYAFGYREPPVSGNAINGLGETRKSRARHVFHSSGGEPMAWKALDDFFSMINPWRVVRHVIYNTWQLRRSEGPVAAARREVADPVPMAAEVKALAKSLGASVVGVTEVTEEDLYEGREPGLRYAICLGLEMDRREMAYAPQARAAAEVMRTYRRVARIAVRLAERIRAMGWPARAYGNPNSTDILMIPLAVRAGLGELGKHGSMIGVEHGSNFRLAAVLTDLPLALDRPVDIGVDDLCLVCRRCVDDCPPRAIYDDKQMVRGERKWYVDFDKCIPYFVKTYGCAICIEVCPWSEPGRGASLSTQLLERRRVRDPLPTASPGG